MKTDALHMALLFDYYGELLTQKQRDYFDLYYNQDFSLAEITEDEGISRQGVHDTLLRAESILNNLEEKIGCVARSKAHKKTLEQIRDWAAAIEDLGDPAAASLAAKILAAVHDIKE